MSHDVHDAESVAWVHLQKAGHQGLEFFAKEAGSEVFRMLCPEQIRTILCQQLIVLIHHISDFKWLIPCFQDKQDYAQGEQV